MSMEFRCCNRLERDDMEMCGTVIRPFYHKGAYEMTCHVCGSDNIDGFWTVTNDEE